MASAPVVCKLRCSAAGVCVCVVQLSLSVPRAMESWKYDTESHTGLASWSTRTHVQIAEQQGGAARRHERAQHAHERRGLQWAFESKQTGETGRGDSLGLNARQGSTVTRCTHKVARLASMSGLALQACEGVWSSQALGGCMNRIGATRVCQLRLLCRQLTKRRASRSASSPPRGVVCVSRKYQPSTRTSSQPCANGTSAEA